MQEIGKDQQGRLLLVRESAVGGEFGIMIAEGKTIREAIWFNSKEEFEQFVEDARKWIRGY